MKKEQLIIGITGGSGSGKTSLIRTLKEQFGTSDVCFISQDDYYLPREKQEVDHLGIKNFDRPSSIDKDAFRKDIRRLLKGQVVEREEYTFNNPDHKASIVVFHPAPVLIVEGLFVLHFKKIRKLLDVRVFLQAKENLKVIRRIRRDQVERNYPLDDVLYRYEHHVLPTFEKFIRPHIDDCDIIINNNRKFDVGVSVLSGFIRQWLQEYKATEKEV